ncbi:hypothetical protein BB558_000787 [Smittium angustum]|uniref:NADP-dependent oxidoreductase domain-containing protein n=1 Tax=Smittium angustum TaxID=133377 RepID=A0A2U1JDG7_SMIAN|nr:hypothetical protein BB558_000787 [Smittium angustum]
MTTLKLSKIGLGTGPLGGPYGVIDPTVPVETIRTAFSNGVNWLDTSPYYGNSETVVGNALEELKDEFPRNTYMISTKVGRYGYSKKDFDYSAERVRASVLESLEKLKTNYLDFVYCHDVEFVDKHMVYDQALPELFKMKKEGIIRNVGISGYPIDLLVEIAQKQFDKGNPLDQVLSYCHSNLHNKQALYIVPLLRSAGVKYVIMASPLSMGLLRSEGPQDWHPASQELKDAVTECIKRCSERNVNLSDLALQAAYAYALHPDSAKNFGVEGPFVDGCLVGMIGKEEVLKSIQALELSMSLDINSKAGDNNHTSSHTEGATEMQECLTIVQEILKPFSEYTWLSPPEDA